MSNKLEKLTQSLFSSEVKQIANLKIKNYSVEIEVEILGTPKDKNKCILSLKTYKGIEYFAYESDINIHEILNSPNKTTWIKQRVSELFMDAEYFAGDLLPRLKNIVNEEHFEHMRKLESPNEYSAMSRSRR